MRQIEIDVNKTTYTLCIGYKQDEKRRRAFNNMCRSFWDFDFEAYYQSGYWDDSCLLYSIFHGDTIVSHTTVSIFRTSFLGMPQRLLQLGTVMTDQAYQRKGLSRFLMEYILEDYKKQVDGFLLFANDTVLDFYPKFGFYPVPEHQAFKNLQDSFSAKEREVRKLDLSEASDLYLFEQLVNKAAINSKVQLYNRGLSFFYCYAYPEFGYKDSIYYVENLDCVAVVREESDGVLLLQEVFAESTIDIHTLISALSSDGIRQVRLGFTPVQEGFEYQEYQNEDLTLFVSEPLKTLFETKKLMIPLLSHT
ncbi:GNAT family N-acetyltransferase [Rapidithrix thailandica]|uniref:GNAT family N-acetyltransferase n=1 Tax=Rapidithrix thailandica TaxID=413964 RepID=A0AAW9SBY9_9BACT